LNRSTWPTCSTAPLRARDGEELPRASSSVGAIGFSTRTLTPRLQEIAGDLEVLFGRHRATLARSTTPISRDGP
jgi:hypothetical protein